MKGKLMAVCLVLAGIFCIILSGCTAKEGDLLQYTAVFDSMGGSAVESQTVEEGGLLSAPQTPVRDGYTFSGWYHEDKRWQFSSDRVYEDLTLYARWQTLSDSDSHILIVYFSYTGNTAAMAEYIEEYTGGVSVEIIAQTPYTAADTDYTASDSRCQTEKRENARPEISDATYGQIEMDGYDTVFIGYPIWNGEEPMIIRTFIEHYGELKDKTVYTFSSSGSSSPASLNTAMKERYPEINIVSNLHLTRSTLSEAEARIRSWLSEYGFIKEEEAVMYLKINGTTLTAALAENTTAKALTEELKKRDITVDMHDYANMEKVGTLGVALPNNDEYICTEAGDIIWYADSALVIYYDTNSWNFTRVGKILNISAAELRELLGSGDVSVTLTLKP